MAASSWSDASIVVEPLPGAPPNLPPMPPPLPAPVEMMDFDKWLHNLEWGTCWDFEIQNAAWGSAGASSQSKLSWQFGGPPPPPGMPPPPPPGPPLGGKGDPFGKGKPLDLDGPYFGDAFVPLPPPIGGPSWGEQGKRKGGRGKSGGGWSEDKWGHWGWSEGGSWKSEWKSDWQPWGGWDAEGPSSGRQARSKGKDGKASQSRASEAWWQQASEGWNDERPYGESSKGGARGRPATGYAEVNGKGDAKSSGRTERGRGRADGTQPLKGRGRGTETQKGKMGGGKDDAYDDEHGEGERSGDVSAEIDALIAQAPVLRKTDFDFRVRRFLTSLKASSGRQRMRDAFSMIFTYTSQKSRESVNNWPAYLLTLLKKFEPEQSSKLHQSTSSTVKAPKAAAEKTKSSSSNPATPAVASSAPAPTAADEGAPSADVAKGGDARKELLARLPEGLTDWEEKRKELSQKIEQSLVASSDKSQLVNPFTNGPLDCSESFKPAGSSLADGSRWPIAKRHLAGVAQSMLLEECSRTASVVCTAWPSSTGPIPDGSSALQAASLLQSKVGAEVANLAFEELGMEVVAKVLRDNAQE